MPGWPADIDNNAWLVSSDETQSPGSNGDKLSRYQTALPDGDSYLLCRGSQLFVGNQAFGRDFTNFCTNVRGSLHCQNIAIQDSYNLIDQGFRRRVASVAANPAMQPHPGRSISHRFSTIRSTEHVDQTKTKHQTLVTD